MRLKKSAILIVLGCAMSVSTSNAFAQLITEGEVKYSWPMVLLGPAIVTKSGTGTVKLNGYPVQTEGQYIFLLGTGPASATHMMHCEVTEIGEKEVTLKVGPKAFATLKDGQTHLQLFRPYPGYMKFGSGHTVPRQATTAEMKAFPDVLALEGINPVDPAKGTSAGSASTGLFASIGAARLAAYRQQSTNNLKQILLAIHNYHVTFNAFPPPVVYGPDGKPWHSWRVLILPYLENTQLYNAYNFGEPWDSPANKRLIDQMPSVYRDPIYQNPRSSFTNYAVVVGPNTVFPDRKLKMSGKTLPLPSHGGFGIRELTDGTSNTFAVVPVSPEQKIPWTKPDDIPYEKGILGLGKPDGIAAPYPTGDDKTSIAPIGFADGSVYSVKDSVEPNVVEKFLTVRGGEIVNRSKLPSDGPVALTSRGLPHFNMLKISHTGNKFKAVVED